jgi:hypothetical protein
MRAVNLSSTAPIRIGAKHDRSGNNDQYHGQLDDVFVRML